MPKDIEIVFKNLGKKRIWAQAIFATNTIEIDHRAKGKKLIELGVHETLHLEFPWLTEEAVTNCAVSISNVLEKLGIHPVDKSNNIKLQDGTF